MPTFAPVKYLLPICLCTLLLSACAKPGEQAELNAHFNTKTFIQQEIQWLEENDVSMLKTISMDGESETHELNPDSAQWYRELRPFAEASIHRPSWSDKYIVKEANNSTNYTATSKKLEVRELSVGYASAGEQANSLDITISGKNLLTKRNESLHYKHQQGFSIDAKRKMLLGGETEVVIEAEFILPN